MKGVWHKKTEGSDVVIFIHGILSSAEKCWKHENGTYWPDLIKKNSSFSELGVYLFTYKTGVFVGDYNLNDVVDALKEQLKIDNVLAKGGRAIFVCHSMGGIVARKYIVDQQLDIYSKDIRASLFLVASPSLGSEYANWLSPFSSNPQAEALKFSKNNVWLNDLDRSFKNLKEDKGYFEVSGKELIEANPKTITKLFGLKKPIVGAISGAKYFGEPIKVPGSDHSSIAKPDGEDDFNHKLLCQFITNELTKPPYLRNIVRFHGTKYNVPGGNDWWNSLMLDASERFYLVGESNKSWINKDDEQKKLLAKAMARIIANNGKVKILSTSTQIVPLTIDFIKKYVFIEADKIGLILSDIVKDSLIYTVAERINYNAVVSDNKLILMPTLNTPMFRNDCMVLELERKSLKSTFNNYIADIERMFTPEFSKKIELS